MSFSRIKSVFGGSNEGEEELVGSGTHDNDDDGPLTQSIQTAKKKLFNLGWREKIIGFLICISIAAVFVIVGCAVATLSVPAFAVLFTVGTIAAIVSTFFLVGPISQAKKFIEFKNNAEIIIKVISVIALVLAVILAIVCGVLKQPALAIIFAIVQFVALICYSITLVPFAMQAIIKGCTTLCSSSF